MFYKLVLFSADVKLLALLQLQFEHRISEDVVINFGPKVCSSEALHKADIQQKLGSWLVSDVRDDERDGADGDVRSKVIHFSRAH